MQEPAELAYFETSVAPLLGLTRYVGEAAGSDDALSAARRASTNPSNAGVVREVMKRTWRAESRYGRRVGSVPEIIDRESRVTARTVQELAARRPASGPHDRSAAAPSSRGVSATAWSMTCAAIAWSCETLEGGDVE